MNKKFWITFIILAAVLAAGFAFRNQLSRFYSYERLIIEKGISDLAVNKTVKQILTPPPLRVTGGDPAAVLTRAGVIADTNTQRNINGLTSLKENRSLNDSAAAKAADMLKNQYFAHVSLSGIGVADLAKGQGYDFIIIGENLALGNFKSDQALVQAWMDSPGHRENILNNRYSDIGVAVIKGVYEGQTVWFAVQHFGASVSSCPKIDPFLNSQIDKNKIEIQNLQENLNALRTDIENSKPKFGNAYSQKINEYNNEVVAYNNLVSRTKNLVSQYNSEVNAFNNCVAGIK